MGSWRNNAILMDEKSRWYQLVSSYTGGTAMGFRWRHPIPYLPWWIGLLQIIVMAKFAVGSFLQLARNLIKQG
jgi:hypothetical protein